MSISYLSSKRSFYIRILCLIIDKDSLQGFADFSFVFIKHNKLMV